MAIDLLRLRANEAERLAYIEGFPLTAKLFARLADLQKAIGEATAEIEALGDELTVLRYDRDNRGFD